MPFKLPSRPQHGVNIPLFSLRSHASCGIGEYLDLIPMIQWCKEVGFNVLQTLPLNDTGPEASPYCALTATALNPIHLSLAQLPGLKAHPHLNEHLNKLQELNALPYVDYTAVLKGKMIFLKEYYSIFKNEISDNTDFRTFFYSSDWLKGYALFKVLKESSQWKSWEEWDTPIRTCHTETLKTLETKFETEIDFQIFLQFLCFRQMEQVKAAAEACSVAIMGDIPILINRESADVWLNQHLFDLTLTAGAPPDQYAQEGQNWGFPTYNWEALKAENYKWWIQRLQYASQLYHLYRIDHVVGFFRIWSIPQGRKALEGRFIPNDPATWIPHGNAILQMMIDSSPMIPIAEDLGTVPDEVRAYLREHSICGTRVMRWERHWHTDRSYIPIEEYNYYSLTTVSTHDSELLTEWWANQPEEAGTYAANRGWSYDKTLNLEHRLDILRESHKTSSLYHINLINEYLDCIPELSWKLPADERINTPGVVSEMNWSLKLSPTVEEIISNAPLKRLIQTLLCLFIIFFCPLPFFSNTLYAESEAHIKMLYSSLSPTSISQHLAFYQLYSDTECGKKALNDSWNLLGRGVRTNNVNYETDVLSRFPELTGSLVALINQKENESVILTDAEVSLIDQIASFLPNRKLKGSRARTAEEVIALPSEEVDLARGLFLSLLDGAPDGWAKMRSYEALLDLMALQVLAKIPFNASPKEKIKAMNELIFFELGYRFPPQSLSIKDIDVYTFLPTVLNSRKGVCLGVSILYLCLAQRLDLPLEMITPPGHIYVRYKNGDHEINIETTCRGVHVDSEYYLSIDTCALEQQNIKQVIALAYINQASVFLGTGKFDLAEIAYKKALVYHPDYDVLHRFLGLSLCLNGKEEEGRAHLERSRRVRCEHQISPDTLADDILNGHINAAGISRFVKHVDSNRAAILEEKQAFEKILEEFPKFRSGWLGLAGSWLELGNERQALKALEAYHELDPNNATVEFYLANLYAKRLDFEKGWDRLCRCEKITQARDYIPEELRDFREQLQQLSPE
jgi:4-alpha-glucanotransferase